MAVNNPVLWLVAYDIRDPRRLRRVHRYLRNYATPIQYSVFLYRATPTNIPHLLKGLEQHINPQEDDVRAYPLPGKLEYHTIGDGPVDGIAWIPSSEHDPVPFHRPGRPGK